MGAEPKNPRIREDGLTLLRFSKTWMAGTRHVLGQAFRPDPGAGHDDETATRTLKLAPMRSRPGTGMTAQVRYNRVSAGMVPATVSAPAASSAPPVHA